MRASNRISAGFTLPEVIVAMGVFAVVLTIAVNGYSFGFGYAKSCGWQVEYTARGRLAGAWLIKYVESGYALAVTTNNMGVDILMASAPTARIAYEDPDNNPNTAGQLVYYADNTQTNRKVVICRTVSQIDTNTPIFRQNSLTPPPSVSFAFHVGDMTNKNTRQLGSASGQGFQGAEVRISATPRNVQRVL